MSMQTVKEHGVFSWNELVTTNVPAAKEFYREALGWELQDLNNPGMAYTIAKKGSREVAGIMAMPNDVQGMPPSWGSYVTVDDVDARVARLNRWVVNFVYRRATSPMWAGSRSSPTRRVRCWR
jgi:predicted enzyme related to lactoylglutathione lyase